MKLFGREEVETVQTKKAPELEGIAPFKNKRETVGNLDIIKWLFIAVAIPVLWYLFFYRGSFDPETLKKAFSEIWVIAPMELFALGALFFTMGKEKRAIKRNGVSTDVRVDIPGLREFCIFRATWDTNYPQYFAVDRDKNMILRFKCTNSLGTRLSVCEPDGTKIGEIDKKLLTMAHEYTVKLADEEPFIVRSSTDVYEDAYAGRYSDYEVIGRNYLVKGCWQAFDSVICDAEENQVATVSSSIKIKGIWRQMRESQFVLKGETRGSLDLLALAFCVALGNDETVDIRRRNRRRV